MLKRKGFNYININHKIIHIHSHNYSEMVFHILFSMFIKDLFFDIKK